MSQAVRIIIRIATIGPFQCSTRLSRDRGSIQSLVWHAGIATEWYAYVSSPFHFHMICYSMMNTISFNSSIKYSVDESTVWSVRRMRVQSIRRSFVELLILLCLTLANTVSISRIWCQITRFEYENRSINMMYSNSKRVYSYMIHHHNNTKQQVNNNSLIQWKRF